MIEVCREAGVAGNCLVTIAIGSQYANEWRKYAAPSWLNYCNKHDLGLYVVVDDLIDPSSKVEKSNLAEIAYRRSHGAFVSSD